MSDERWGRVMECMAKLGPGWDLRTGYEKREGGGTFASATLFRVCPEGGWSDEDMVDSNGRPRHPADRMFDRAVMAVSAENPETLLGLTLGMLLNRQPVESPKPLAGGFPHSEVDRSSPDWANVAHLRHVFEGYRTVMLEWDASCPYSPGGARAISWEVGAKQAREDLHPNIQSAAPV